MRTSHFLSLSALPAYSKGYLLRTTPRCTPLVHPLARLEHTMGQRGHDVQCMRMCGAHVRCVWPRLEHERDAVPPRVVHVQHGGSEGLCAAVLLGAEREGRVRA